MNAEQQQVSAAIKAQKDLQQIHGKFIARIASMDNKSVNGGSFTTMGDDFSASALGVKFRVVRRPISTNRQFVASEYAFITEHDRKDLCIWCLYLDHTGHLYTNSALSNQLCDIGNTYLLDKVVAALANSLLASAVFAPSV